MPALRLLGQAALRKMLAIEAEQTLRLGLRGWDEVPGRNVLSQSQVSCNHPWDALLPTGGFPSSGSPAVATQHVCVRGASSRPGV